MAFLTLIIVASAVICLVTTYFTSKKAPTGLRNVPEAGRLKDLSKYPQREWRKWAQQYGELFQIRLGWENWVFVNSPEAVKVIFNKQSQHTSSRAPSPVLSDLISGDMRMLLMPYTPKWRKLRAIVHQLLTPKSSDNFKPSQEFEAKQLLWDICTDNSDQENFYMHIRRYTTSVVMTSTYGRRIPQWDCEDIREIYGLMQDFSEAAEPGKYLAELFPPLSKLPVWMQWWRESAERSFQRQASIWMKYFSDLQRSIKKNEAPECFVKSFIESDYEKNDISDLQASFVAGTMIEAGSETTSSALNSCVKYFAAYPKAQAKAYAEIKKVVGESRFPSFDDEEKLPYIRACVKEILRIRPITNIGTPHYTTANVVYKDYFIPAGTVVTINHYALHFDPKRWENPDDFIPDRYLDYPFKAGVYVASPYPEQQIHFDFGAGRRICPGMHLAENSLFITIASIIWAFEILPPIEDGKVGHVDVSDAAYAGGVNTLPKQSKLRFVPRSEEVKRTILTGWPLVKAEGYMLGDIKVDAEGMVFSLK
ncbi:uncharacterized protein N7503_003129 [Penicillium pulvis]|uniref:uncharacterized protein n=1 Tax=Penicillium pulvis TaxID=1562058 RepID=UPI0025469435|nr:uncharacterized protein N7503_003129 [Penicillium pulvis]KAJ5805527.1 hypothetical protein N7503_003129 [Penicillium pulvis]